MTRYSKRVLESRPLKDALALLQDAIENVESVDDTGSPGYHWTCCAEADKHAERCWLEPAINLMIVTGRGPDDSQYDEETRMSMQRMSLFQQWNHIDAFHNR